MHLGWSGDIGLQPGSVLLLKVSYSILPNANLGLGLIATLSPSTSLSYHVKYA